MVKRGRANMVRGRLVDKTNAVLTNSLSIGLLQPSSRELLCGVVEAHEQVILEVTGSIISEILSRVAEDWQKLQVLRTLRV